MSKLFWTGDTHFNHGNIIAHDNRPFDDLDHMVEEMVDRWNGVVDHGDTVFHLGDFGISYGKKDFPVLDEILSKLNGQKWLIKGNHDRKEVTGNPRWTKVCDYHEIKVDLGGIHKQRIVMSHYPFLSWNQQHRGSFMLHGHCHQNLKDQGGRILDVGCMGHNYTPIELDWIVEYMKTRKGLYLDHHTE